MNSGMDLYRIRVGDHRVVYVVDDKASRLLVTRVAHRRDVYRNL
ncbi:MAG: type II toxin-antitoxin system RelE/ParE family toxin [Actinomycetota bacterium]